MRPAADRAKLGCPHRPRAHSYCDYVGSALRDAVFESLCDRPAPAPMRRVAQSAWLAAHSAQLSCPRHDPPQALHYCVGSALRYVDAESHSDCPALAPTLWGAHSACQWQAEDSLAARVSLVPTSPVSLAMWAALWAARTTRHAVTAPPPPRCGGLRKVPGQRRIARSSAARTHASRPPAAVQGTLGAAWRASHSVTAPLPPPCGGPRSAPC